MWWRILIPTWRFFDVVQPEARIMVREANGEWHQIHSRPKFPWYSLFFNPDGSYYHAVNNLLERLVAESRVADQNITTLVSYQLVEDLVRDYFSRSGSGAIRVEFKVTWGEDDILLNPTLEMRA
jgi:hypothetical protein